jgi:hypothetical protein
MSKTCKDCGEEKPLDGFYAHSRMADGFLNKCKECVKARVAKHRSENLDQIRNYDRSRDTQEHRIAARKAARKAYAKTDSGKEAKRKGNQKWSSQNKHKTRAHRRVAYALRTGKLKRQACYVCGDDATEAHHEDYSKPLDVLWLCDGHHREIHKQKRQHGREQETALT